MTNPPERSVRSGPVQILMVEDNPGDVELTRLALEDASFDSQLHVVHDGEQALQFANREAPYEHAPAPDLILLDLKLPRLGGHRVLEGLRARGIYTPVVVLSSSEAPADIAACYRLGANCYIAKPVDFAHFRDTVLSIERFWLSVARLPTA